MSDAVFSALVLTAAPPGYPEGGGGLVKLDGREALLRSVELFLNRPNIKQIQLVVSGEAEEEVKRKFGGNLGFMGAKLAVGGKKWSEQLAAAAPKILAEATHVLIHDVARPLTPSGDIDTLLDAAAKKPAVVLAAPLSSSLIELDHGGLPVALRPPADFMLHLSPMVLSKQRFTELTGGREVHASELTLVRGSALNIRVGPGDASLAKAMLNLLPKPKAKAPSNPFEEAQW
ncbi:MAG TPA: 2-C-methyl-D-erythritol 4-phosphate cytidylyltransferase [Tepidisphaeraceae bacterium]|nr:2-C-methyl-D-erythritol 4-phosphate cytidylyltransferase [Tepidisphaeraceae bacterium]